MQRQSTRVQAIKKNLLIKAHGTVLLTIIHSILFGMDIHEQKVPRSLINRYCNSHSCETMLCLSGTICFVQFKLPFIDKQTASSCMAIMLQLSLYRHEEPMEINNNALVSISGQMRMNKFDTPVHSWASKG